MTLTGAAKLTGVLGWPVGHSRSPRLHGFWLAQYGIDGAYVPLPVRPEHFAKAMAALAILGFRGANVTIPHKEAAFAAVDIRTPTAERARSVNLVVVRDDGRLLGDSTDGFGFMENLRQSVRDWAPEQCRAAVLGAGGGAAAVAMALLDAGVPELVVVNRGLERAAALAKALGPRASVAPWQNRAEALAGAGLLVNATVLGMKGQPPLEIEMARLRPGSVVADLVYVPLETDLLRRARSLGHRAVDGLGMLLHQARPAFKAWFGVDPEVTPALRALLAEGLD